jgi:TolB-like protein/tetratricopeptide (TPR) repeat protein
MHNSTKHFAEPQTVLSSDKLDGVETGLPEGERRLAAIMFTDMVGYTALTQRDEASAMSVLEEHRSIIRPYFPKHGGREVKTIGDAFLIEFGSALEAVRCAYDIQQSLHELNNSRSGEKRVQLRIGIHLGDVIHSQSDVYGDAVNVASRIEPLATPGGICISEEVYRQVRNKFEFPMSSLGRRELRNVGDAVEIFQIVLPWEGQGAAVQGLDSNRVAVLPFANISPDPADEYFADGLTEELITRLSLVKGLKVIARTSVMNYKNKEKRISDIGTELKVGSVVEGSVRKAGNRIRVTAQLIDIGTEEHLWASSYDKDLDDIFAVQSEIASKITESLPGILSPSKSPTRIPGGTSNIRAYTKYLKGMQLRNEGTDDSIRQALELFMDATKIDPSFARAYVEIGNCYASLGVRNYIPYGEVVAGMRSGAERALKIDENLAEGHALLSFLAWAEDDFGKDEEEARLAIQLNPSLAIAYVRLATVRETNGYLKNAIGFLETAHQLDPLSGEIVGRLGEAYLWSGRERDTLDLWNENRKVAPKVVADCMASYYMQKGDLHNAEEEVKALEAAAPDESHTILQRGCLSALKGDSKAAEATIETLRRKFKQGARIDNDIGYIRFFLGDLDAYFAAMFRAVETHIFNPLDFRYSPLFERARRDPRYREVLTKNRLDPDVKE